MFCRKCGTENSDHARFCTNCGADMGSNHQQTGTEKHPGSANKSQSMVKKGMLYESRGLSLEAYIGKGIGIILFLALGIWIYGISEKDVLFFQSGSDIVFYTRELRNVVKLFGMLFIVESVFEVVGAILCANAWIEIYPDRIMGKNKWRLFKCNVTEIQSVTKFGDTIYLKTGSGWIGVISKEPKEVHKLMKGLIHKESNFQ